LRFVRTLSPTGAAIAVGGFSKICTISVWTLFVSNDFLTECALGVFDIFDGVVGFLDSRREDPCAFFCRAQIKLSERSSSIASSWSDSKSLAPYGSITTLLTKPEKDE